MAHAPIKLAYNYFHPTTGKEVSPHPVIFLHGLTISKESWDDMPQTIADSTRRKVYALDARNHGDSEFVDFFNFDINADDLLHFMDSIDAQKAILIGHSMGGITAIKTALKKPEKIEKLFVEDMHTKTFSKEYTDKVIGFIKVLSTSFQSIPNEINNYSEALRYATDVFYSKIPPGTENVPSKEVFCNHKFAVNRKADGSYDLKLNKDAITKALQNTETMMSKYNGQFKGPAHFIYGRQSDLRIWEAVKDIMNHFPNAELIEFEKATHNLHMEFPEEYIATLIQRINS